MRMSKYQKSLLIVDGSNLAHRSYQKFLNLKSGGIPTGLIYGFMRLLQGYILRFRPTYVIITFDTRKSKDSNFRLKLLGDYKIHREDEKHKLRIDYEDFNSQLRVVKRLLKYLNIPVVWDKKGLGHESDDYIAYFANKHPGKVVIISSDKDFCQLITSQVKVFNPFKEVILRTDNCKDVMGYSPEECIDYLCLVGDKSDDIPGYQGMGPVKTRKFLDEWGSIQNFLDKKGEFRGIDYEGLQAVYKRNVELISLEYAIKHQPFEKIPLVYNQKDRINEKKVRETFLEYSFHSFLTKDFMKAFRKLQVWREEDYVSN
jgi:DNA polymerase-1|uniref:Exodeoxyribonuclease n=1 Tax=Myoviridae sp. ctx322 TaxID=2826711 RepID=A0A8S5N9P4_9CAUD|nr:MAG TPA: Exodeoxyribonuclease [Myoviridae sp. ctx322]